MSRWRVIVVLVLIVLPLFVMAGIGSYYLWREGRAFLAWWPLAGCMILGYLLAWHWQRKQQLLKPTAEIPPLHWTERDHEAWKIVESRAQEAAKLDPNRVGELQFYVDTGRELALELARFYHPQAQDPIGDLTIPEILAVIELAAHDLSRSVDQYLPGGHLLTIDQWRQARQLTGWYQRASKVYWLISAVFAPIETGLRYATSQLGMSRPWQMLQQNLIAWFYTAYVHRLGTYLIDLNSGRLRVGAARYRELVHASPAGAAPPAAPPAVPAAEPSDQVRQVTLLSAGQVKSGKSSFINAVLGEQRAGADVLPVTAGIQRYAIQPAGIPTRLLLLDSVGYGHSGPKEDDLHATEEEARQADLILLVLHAKNPARQADLEFLQRLRRWFLSQPELRMPPVLGVLTHIDLLSPAMEWAPPYNWRNPEEAALRPKERSIRDAWTALREQLGEYLVGIVPMCTASGKVYGLEEWFLPTLIELLDEARAVALLRCLRAELDAGKVRKVFQQLLAAGQEAARLAWKS